MEQVKREMVRIVDNSKPREDFESKRYLICIMEETDAAPEKDWVIVIGRTSAYEYIKDTLEIMKINMRESFILVESLKLSDRRSIYSFMSFVQDNYKDGFDIDEYVTDEFSEDEFVHASNQIDPGDENDVYNMIQQSNHLNMEDTLNGSVKSVDLN